MPWYVWKIGRGRATRYIVLLEEFPFSIPGGSSACVQLYDKSMRRIGSSSFRTGWRLMPGAASLRFSEELDRYVIVLTTLHVINGPHIAREFLAIGDDRARVVRLEDEKGTLLGNDYRFANSQIGSVPDATSEGEWLKILSSGSKPEMLEALEFLGGRHEDGSLRSTPSVQFEQTSYDQLFAQLISSPNISELVANLTKSGNKWIHEAARFAVSRESQDQ